MCRTMLQLGLLVPVAVGLAVSAASPGCSGPASTSPPVTGIDLARQVFPSAADITEMSVDGEPEASERSGKTTVRRIRGPSRLLGYLVESKVVGRSGPFSIAVLLDDRFVIKRAIVVSYPWSHGREVARRSFTRQFEGKGLEDTIEIGKDIDVVTGATISCQAMTLGVREAVRLVAH